MTESEPMPEENRASPAEDSAHRAYRPSTAFLVVVTVVSAAADLGTKWWAKAALSGGEKGKTRHIEVIKDHFDFIYTLNPGGAWSFLRGLPENLRRPFFLFVSAAAIVFIVSVYRRIHRDQWAMRWGLPLALGGAIGNLVDRIRYGSVIDFIDMYAIRNGREMHWPTYNVADVAIVAGVVLMALDTFLSRGSRARSTTPPKQNAEPAGSTEPTNEPSITAVPLVPEPVGNGLPPAPKD
jgi:signal peptidase II